MAAPTNELWAVIDIKKIKNKKGNLRYDMSSIHNKLRNINKYELMALLKGVSGGVSRIKLVWGAAIKFIIILMTNNTL